MGLLLVLAAVLAAACSSKNAVDVNPAKDDLPTVAEPAGDPTPSDDAAKEATNEADPEPSADTPPDEDAATGDEPGDIAPDDGGAGDRVDPVDPADEPAAVPDTPDEHEEAEVVSRSVEAAAPATGNGWRRISPVADLVDVAASGD